MKFTILNDEQLYSQVTLNFLYVVGKVLYNSRKEVVSHEHDLSDYDNPLEKKQMLTTSASFDPSRICCRGMQIEFQHL